MRRGILSSLPFLILALAASAQDRARFGISRLDPPQGWTRSDQDGRAVWTAPDGKVTVTLTAGQPLAEPQETVMDALLQQARPRREFREESKRSGGKHTTTGGHWYGLVYSYVDDARPNLYAYDWVVTVAAGGRYVTLVATAHDLDAYRRHGGTVAKMVEKLALSTAIVVEKGRPPLTRHALDETIDFLEWLMHSPLTEAQKLTVEAEVRGYWQKKSQTDMDDIRELLEGREQLAKMKAEERELARQAVLQEALKQWREEKDSPSARMLLEIHAAAHQPIAKGTPPLTRQAVDAFSEFLYFAAGKTAGVTASPPKDVKDKLAGEVAAGYAAMPAEQRELIAGMPLTWAALRVAWPDLSEAERKSYVDSWRKSEALAALGRQLQASSASKLGELQARLQAQQATFTMMSNIMRMQHETSMIIASNIGGGGWRYEYRW